MRIDVRTISPERSLVFPIHRRNAPPEWERTAGRGESRWLLQDGAPGASERIDARLNGGKQILTVHFASSLEYGLYVPGRGDVRRGVTVDEK